MYGTPFVETELLLAVMDDDYPQALTLLGQMLPNERRDLAATADRLARFLRTGLLAPEQPTPRPPATQTTTEDRTNA